MEAKKGIVPLSRRPFKTILILRLLTIMTLAMPDTLFCSAERDSFMVSWQGAEC